MKSYRWKYEKYSTELAMVNIKDRRYYVQDYEVQHLQSELLVQRGRLRSLLQGKLRYLLGTSEWHRIQ